MIGRVIGNYKIESELGGGGFGKVYKAHDWRLDRQVAIKVLRPEFADDAQIAERFQVEARALAALQHPNIVSFYALEQHGDALLMVMEAIDGWSLKQRLATGEPVAIKEAIALVAQIACGLDYAHARGIVHRDIKPANLMVERDDKSLKIVDFGIARMADSGHVTRHGDIVGAAHYMAPEQILGRGVDGRSDIYSLGVVFYELLTGLTPFSGTPEFEVMRSQLEETPPPMHTIRPGIPTSLERIVCTALQKRPGDRFQTARDFLKALASSDLLPPSPGIPSPGYRRFLARIPFWASMLAAVGITGLVVTRTLDMPPSNPANHAFTAPSKPDATSPAAGNGADTPKPGAEPVAPRAGGQAQLPDSPPAPPVPPIPEPEPPAPTEPTGKTRPRGSPDDRLAGMATAMAVALPSMPSDTAEQQLRRYLAADLHRALAVAPRGRGTYDGDGYAGPTEAEEVTLERCQLLHGGPCTLFAVDDEVRTPEPGTEWMPRAMPRVAYAGAYDAERVPGVTADQRLSPPIGDYARSPGFKAMALDQWGRPFAATKVPNQRAAEARALDECNADLKSNGREGLCLLYAVGNRVVLPSRATRPISSPPSPAPSPRREPPWPIPPIPGPGSR